MPTKRTTLRLSDDRQQLLDKASEIVADSPQDDPPMADVIDAALTHLVESKQNIQDARVRDRLNGVRWVLIASVLDVLLAPPRSLKGKSLYIYVSLVIHQLTSIGDS